MKKIIILSALFFIFAAIAQAEILSTTFLKTGSLPRLNQDYFDDQYGEGFIGFTQPSGGALIRVPGLNCDRHLYIFCDNPTHRLLIYSLTDSLGVRNPRSVMVYGLQVDEPLFAYEDTGTTNKISFSAPDRSGREYLDRPVDIVTSAIGRYFNVGDDKIYVLDQANHQVVRFEYNLLSDSLIWLDTFGSDLLEFPTAIAYANYGDADYSNDDVYVTDAAKSSVLRFSADGIYETYFGGWAKDISGMAYPSGVAVASYENCPNRIFVTDSHNHRVVRYYSASYSPIIAEVQYIFPLTPLPLISSVATDEDALVYVVDSFLHYIYVLKANLSGIEQTYGSRGFERGEFDYPSDIYIDGNEMQICELWGDSSGIQSYEIQSGSPKRESGQLPYTFQLFQNYPNPFNSTTMIMFELDKAGKTSLFVYNILGQRVKVLFNNDLPTGRHNITWDGRNQSGDAIASGVYFFVLNQDEKTDVKKLLLLK